MFIRCVSVLLLFLLLVIVSGFMVLLVASQGWWTIPVLLGVTVTMFIAALLD